MQHRSDHFLILSAKIFNTQSIVLEFKRARVESSDHG